MIKCDNFNKVCEKVNYYCDLIEKSSNKDLAKSFYYSANGYLCAAVEFNFITDTEWLDFSCRVIKALKSYINVFEEEDKNV